MLKGRLQEVVAFTESRHLSLLIAYADKNKTDYRNLYVYFQPALQIDSPSFQIFVYDWRDCWQRSWTGKEALGLINLVRESGLPFNGSGGRNHDGQFCFSLVGLKMEPGPLR